MIKNSMCKYIAIDGFDGSGKSTLIENLMNLLAYENKISMSERLLPLTVGLFKEYASGSNEYMNTLPDRFRYSAYLWESFCRLNLLYDKYQSYEYVFFDRWIYTNLVETVDWAGDEKIIRFLINKMPKPDILFLVDVDPDTVLRRLKKKNDWMLSFYSKDEIRRNVQFFYEGYKKILNKEMIYSITLDGTKSPSELASNALEHIHRLDGISTNNAVQIGSIFAI